MDFINVLLIIGGILGLVISIAKIYVYFESRITAFRRKPSPNMKKEIDSVGELLEDDWQKIAGNGIHVIKDVETHYIDGESPFSKELHDLSEGIEKQIKNRRKSGDKSVWNGERFRLIRFSEGRTTKQEDITLTLDFERSWYSRFLATKKYLDKKITADGKETSWREYYLENSKPTQEIVTDLVSDFGVSLLAVTSDNYLILTKRKGLAVSPHKIHLSCHEGLARGGRNPDLDEHGNPDVLKAAMRSLTEETQIAVQPRQISWILFGHDKTTWEYNLHGVVRVNMSWKEVQDKFNLLAKDASLEHTLYEPPVEANITEVIKFLNNEWENIHPLAKNAIFYSLIHITDRPDKILHAFREELA